MDSVYSEVVQTLLVVIVAVTFLLVVKLRRDILQIKEWLQHLLSEPDVSAQS